jgi:hypothetical protein
MVINSVEIVKIFSKMTLPGIEPGSTGPQPVVLTTILKSPSIKKNLEYKYCY